MLFEILSDLLKLDDLLFIVKSNAATSEIKSNALKIKQRENWITIGANDDSAHMHINSELIKTIKFIQEEKLERTSFSVRFFDDNGDRSLAVFFTKMYDKKKNLDLSKTKIFDNLCQKYGLIIKI